MSCTMSFGGRRNVQRVWSGEGAVVWGGTGMGIGEYLQADNFCFSFLFLYVYTYISFSK